jgi:hypothetical protein
MIKVGFKKKQNNTYLGIEGVELFSWKCQTIFSFSGPGTTNLKAISTVVLCAFHCEI